jgi:hypothetical protein
MNFRFPQCPIIPLKTLVPNASPEAIAIMEDMMLWNPEKRPTAVQVKSMPLFSLGNLPGEKIFLLGTEVCIFQSRSEARRSGGRCATSTPTSSNRTDNG